MSEISVNEFNFGEELVECYSDKKSEEKLKSIIDYDSIHIRDLQNLLHKDIFSNEKKYIKENSKIDVINILKDYKEELSNEDLMVFSGVINGLWEDGYLDGEDYFDSMKWVMNEL